MASFLLNDRTLRPHFLSNIQGDEKYLRYKFKEVGLKKKRGRHQKRWLSAVLKADESRKGTESQHNTGFAGDEILLYTILMKKELPGERQDLLGWNGNIRPLRLVDWNEWQVRGSIF